jgi:hypothetical protein
MLLLTLVVKTERKGISPCLSSVLCRLVWLVLIIEVVLLGHLVEYNLLNSLNHPLVALLDHVVDLGECRSSFSL